MSTKYRNLWSPQWLGIVALVTVVFSCDRHHKKACEWYLLPDEDRVQMGTEAVLPVCARNLTINKQDCRLIAEAEFVKANFKRKFRYVDLKVSGRTVPRKVEGIKFCD